MSQSEHAPGTAGGRRWLWIVLAALAAAALAWWLAHR
jgi:hypothetical protein